jgi:23S rRNA (uracil1939-C5)-methyltransferase
MKENDQFILDIKRLGINGEGIGFYKRLAVFVDGAIPGGWMGARLDIDGHLYEKMREHYGEE